MPSIALLVICLSSISHGRRITISNAGVRSGQHAQSQPVIDLQSLEEVFENHGHMGAIGTANSLKALLMLLGGLNPAASSKLIPFAYGGLGSALLSRAVKDAPHEVDPHVIVLASSGLLCLCSLALVDNRKYAGAKRAVALYKDKTNQGKKDQSGMRLAKRWYRLVQVLVFGRLSSLVWMVSAGSPAGVLCSAATMMSFEMLTCLLGAPKARHDGNGLPAPLKPGIEPKILTFDFTVICLVLLAAISSAGSLGRACGSYIWSAACLLAAKQDLPQTIAALKGFIV